MKILITSINEQAGHALMQNLNDHEFIGLIRQDCNLTQPDPDFNINNLHAIQTHEYLTKTKRSENSILRNAKIKNTFNLNFNNWLQELRKIIRG